MNQISQPNPNSLSIVSLNMLLDKTRTAEGLVEPQHQRVSSLALTLGSLPVGLNVVLLQEAHITKKHDNVTQLADELGLEYRAWFPHNRKGEHLAVLANRQLETKPIDVGDNRIALVSTIGDIALYNVHNRAGVNKWKIREEQMRTIVEHATKTALPKTIIAGDTNDVFFSPSRKVLRRSGFTPVFRHTGPLPFIPGTLPRTFPTPNYREIMLDARKRKAIPLGVSIDTIETKGFIKNDILQAGTVITEKSDHRTLYAEFRS